MQVFLQQQGCALETVYERLQCVYRRHEKALSHGENQEQEVFMD